MIPKIIHYCWFGGNPLPELAQKCIASWKKYCPDYEIIEWNESNFDFSDCAYAKEAYEAKKWAFVSDYARFKILYENGGVYFDTDVEIIKPIDDIIEKGAFFGCEQDGMYSAAEIELINVDDNDSSILDGILVAPGLGMASESGNLFYEKMLDFYHNNHFIDDEGNLNLDTVVINTTKALFELELRNINEQQKIGEIIIYPKEYFCPIDCKTGELMITKETRTIHHYAASWMPKETVVYRDLYFKFNRCFPQKIAHWLSLTVCFSKCRGVMKMPKAMIEYKLNNLNKRK